LQSDNGGKYISKGFEAYLACAGIMHEPGPLHSPELNGVAEQMNCTISNLIQCSLLNANVPKSFWADALCHLLFTLNAIPCKTASSFDLPNTLLGLQDPDLCYLHPFGCLSWYKVPEENRQKLDKKGCSSLLLLYLPDGNGYHVWDLERRTVVKSRDILFDNLEFPYGTSLVSRPKPVLGELEWLPDSTDTKTSPLSNHPPPWPVSPISNNPPANHTPTPHLPLLNIQLAPRFDRRLKASIHAPPLPSASAPQHVDTTTFCPSRPITDEYTPPVPEQAQSPPVEHHEPAAPASKPKPTSSPSTTIQPMRKSSRTKHQPDNCYGTWSKSASVEEDIDTPKTWKQLLKSPTKQKWLKAADKEFSLLLGMGTWGLVPLPEKRKIIKSKWIFKIKRRADRSIQKLKACLVAMGYTQVHGIDYNKVFAPMLRQETF
jgi:hypothetical protein